MAKSLDNVNQSGRTVADEVFESIHEVMHLYRSQRNRAPEDGEDALSHMESKVIGFFARHPGSTQSDLATHSGRDKSQLARLVGSLRERGLLEVKADEADRRNLRIELTEDARALHKSMQLRARRLTRSAITGLSQEECEQLVDLLSRVRANLVDATRT